MSRRDHHSQANLLTVNQIVERLDRGDYDSSVQDTIEYLLSRLGQAQAIIDQMESEIRRLTTIAYNNE